MGIVAAYAGHTFLRKLIMHARSLTTLHMTLGAKGFFAHIEQRRVF